MRTGLVSTNVAAGVTRLSEQAITPVHRSYFYLIEGTERFCLFDSGYGLGWTLGDLDLDPQKPLVAIASHSHYDHVGRLFECHDRRAHAAEADIYARMDPQEIQAFPFLSELEVLSDGALLTPASYQIPPAPLGDTISDEDEINIGGRTLTVIHTPGHSPGSVSLFDADNRLLFCADVLHDGYIFDDIPGADPVAVRHSHARLLMLNFDYALPGHGAVLSKSEFSQRAEDYLRRQSIGDFK